MDVIKSGIKKFSEKKFTSITLKFILMKIMKIIMCGSIFFHTSLTNKSLKKKPSKKVHSGTSKWNTILQFLWKNHYQWKMGKWISIGFVCDEIWGWCMHVQSRKWYQKLKMKISTIQNSDYWGYMVIKKESCKSTIIR